MSALTNTTDAYTGRHRQLETQPIALPPAAPLHGALSRPLRRVPAGDPTTAMPALRMYPELQPQPGLSITRRGYAGIVVVGAPAACLALYGFWNAVGALGQMVGAN